MKKRLLALMAKKGELKQNTCAIVDAAIAENRALTDEEQTKVDAMKKELEGMDSMIASLTEMLEEDEGRPVDEALRDARVDEKRKSTGFGTLGEQLQAVARAAAGRHDSRFSNSGSPSGMNEGTSADGGYLVDTDFTNDLMRGVRETGVLINKVSHVGISAGANGLVYNTVNETSRANGSRYGGIQAYWVDEAEAPTSTKPAFKRTTLALEKLMGLCYVTEEMLEDVSALQQFVTMAFTKEFGFKIDDAILNGTGSGQPTGVLSGSGLVTIAKETSQTDALKLENLIKMEAAFDGKNGEWYMNKELYPFLYTLNANNNYFYIPGGTIEGRPFGTLLGRPVNFIEQCAAAKAKGDIILADMSDYLMIDKGGLRADESIHVKFSTDEMAFRFVYRMNGAPLTTSALTPYKGSQTTSPYVTLAART